MTSCYGDNFHTTSPFCAESNGGQRIPPTQGHKHKDLIMLLLYVWINIWTNNEMAGEMRRFVYIYIWLMWRCCKVVFTSTGSLDSYHRSHNKPDKYSTMHPFVTEMVTRVHISVTKRCISSDWTGSLRIYFFRLDYFVFFSSFEIHKMDWYQTTKLSISMEVAGNVFIEYDMKLSAHNKM